MTNMTNMTDMAQHPINVGDYVVFTMNTNRYLRAGIVRGYGKGKYMPRVLINAIQNEQRVKKSADPLNCLVIPPNCLSKHQLEILNS